MGKIIGCLIVAAATFGFLFSWQEGRKERIARLNDMAEFYGRAYYALGTEQMRITDFLRNPQVKDIRIREFCTAVMDRLLLFVYPTGEAAWEESCRENKRQLGLSAEQWEFLKNSGKAFFGRCGEENLRKLKSYKEQAKVMAYEEQQDFADKKKVFTPVSLLGGAAVIILLL